MDTKFDALKALGAGDFEHLNGSLMSHLDGTRAILQGWGAAPALCDAGLFHAAYGTAGFDDNMVSLSQRQRIADIIGKAAEAQVYLYCACDRDYVNARLGTAAAIRFRDRFTGDEFLLSGAQSRYFCELTVANELELVYDSPAFKARYGQELLTLFDNMRPFLSASAIDAYQTALTDVATAIDSFQ